METIITRQQQLRTLSQELGPILSDITWGNIAREYMGKSPSWIYNKLRGRDGNGGAGGFTPAEVEQLREALASFSRRIGEVALSL